jgi:hypothetical protein
MTSGTPGSRIASGMTTSNSRHCEAPESGPIPHTDLEPDPVTASVARQSMQSEVMDCHVADAPRNDGHFRNDDAVVSPDGIACFCIVLASSAGRGSAYLFGVLGVYPTWLTSFTGCSHERPVLFIGRTDALVIP